MVAFSRLSCYGNPAWATCVLSIVVLLEVITPSSAIAQSDNKTTAETALTQTAQAADLKPQIREWSKTITAAGKLFKRKKFDESADLVNDVQRAIESHVAAADAKTLKLLKPIHKKLSKAHQLLTAQNVTLRSLKPFPETDAKKNADKTKAPQTDQVSFVNQVAPIIVSKCGNCHVSQSRGAFSSASFAALDQSTMVTFGMPDQSRIVEVIESGEMPKGNRKVAPEELALLKTWIAQGAKFDGDNPQTKLDALSSPSAPMSARESMNPRPLTGKETVSFGLHVAPVLLENCAECHIARNPRGDFDMASLATFLRGGDAGAPLKPGSSATSEIMLRLKGQDRDVMPPTGKLADKTIEQIGKWIDEGARYDSADRNLPLKAMAAKAFANSLDHEGLAVFRADTSRELWKLAFADLQSNEATTENFFVFGTSTKPDLEDFGQQAEELAGRVMSVLKSPADAKVAKGNVALFALNARYDFSEFGKMIEKRNFNKSETSSWKGEPAVTYVVALVPAASQRAKSATDDSNDMILAKDLAAVHVSSWNPTIPRWFADGMALWTVAKMYRRNPRIEALNQEAAAAVASMKKPDDFITGAMAADKAGFVGYQFVKILQTDSRAFKQLTKDLRDEKNFDAAFEKSFGITPKEFFGNRGKKRGKSW